jgi:hypothetical protein
VVADTRFREFLGRCGLRKRGMPSDLVERCATNSAELLLLLLYTGFQVVNSLEYKTLFAERQRLGRSDEEKRDWNE